MARGFHLSAAAEESVARPLGSAIDRDQPAERARRSPGEAAGRPATVAIPLTSSGAADAHTPTRVRSGAPGRSLRP